MKIFSSFLILFLTGFMISCSNNSEDDLTDIPDTDAVTYTANIKTLIDDNCVGCHGNPLANGAPFPMTNYDELVEAAKNKNIIGRMSSTSNPMPPSGTLPSSTVDLVKKWIEDGFPE